MAKTTAQYLTSVANSKEAIRQSIIKKGQSCGKTVPFSEYAGKIMAITSGTEIVVQSNADFYQCVFCSDTSWSGYKAVLKDGKYKFETKLTEGLKYTSVKPEVGKIYTVDALAQIAYLYDIGSGNIGGQCPNLAECVVIACEGCGVEFCDTHVYHECESGGGGGKKCPELSTCNVIACSSCGKSFCATHDKHECDDDGDDNGDDNGEGGNDKPENCPYGDGCVATTCPDCGEVYCAFHAPHQCNAGECPDGRYCVPTTCSCGASYCAMHQQHPSGTCCEKNGCTYNTCEKCGTKWCTKHGSHIAADCCPNTKDCHVEECEKADCSNTYCKTHGAEYNCSVCGGEYCSKTCYMTHLCNVSETCNRSDCNNNAYQTCVNCGKYYCLNHLKDHNCKPETTDKCSIDGCGLDAVNYCESCGHPRCSDHSEICGTCGKFYCLDHVGVCGCGVPKCPVDGCTNPREFICEGCGDSFCTSHATPCERCDLIYCVNCMSGHNHEPVCNGVQGQCDNCAKQICTDAECSIHEHAYMCQDGCTGTFCPDCAANHKHDSGSKCTYPGCTNPATQSCSNCGAGICLEGGHVFDCPTCLTLGLCSNCFQGETGHECKPPVTIVQCDYCSRDADVTCTACGMKMCCDDLGLNRANAKGKTCPICNAGTLELVN